MKREVFVIKNQHLTRWRGVSFAFIAIAVVGVVYAPSAQAYTQSELDEKLADGINSAVNWDNSCRNKLATNPGATFSSSGGGALRGLLNGTPSGIYGEQVWLSAAGKGNIRNPLNVTYGASQVPIQLNAVQFICGSGVEPNSAQPTAGASCSTSITSQMLLNQSERWVNPAVPASIDRSPNRMAAGCMNVTKNESRTKIYDIKVVEDVNADTGQPIANGSVIGWTPGHEQIIPRSNTSRYWFAAPMLLQYSNTTNPLRENRKITLELSQKSIGGFNANNSSQSCGQTITSRWNYDPCPMNISRLSILLSVQGEWGSRANTGVSSSIAFVGQPIQWRHTVYKSGTGSGPSSARREIRQTIDGAPTPGPTGWVTDSLANPAQGLDLSASVPTGDQLVFDQNSTYTPQPNDMGKTICRQIIWDPSSHADADGALNDASNLACVTVAKIPFVSVTGSDLMVRSVNSSYTSSATIDGTVFGSWLEYGGIAQNSLHVATGATIARGNTTPTTPLTFANSPSGTTGNFGALPASSPLRPGANWPTVTIPGNAGSLDALTNKTVSVVSPGYQIGQSDNIAKSIIVRSSGKVVITGNITYSDGPYTDPASLPQVIIQAGDIEIAEGVTRIDAWLIATASGTSTGKVSTCGWPTSGPYYTGLTIDNCNQHLTINGPVQADHLWLRRTGGADGVTPESRRVTGETINGRADAILWTRTQSSSTTIRTQSVRELAPRF